MKKNITRIKINNKSIMKISCSGKKDYIFAIPKITVKETYCESHFTFHTKNNRLTFKITDFGNDKNNFDTIKEEARNKSFYVTENDIDLLKNKKIKEKDICNFLNPIFTFAYFDKKDDYLNTILGKQKTKDEKFPKIIQINIPYEFCKVEIKSFISKNLDRNPVSILSNKNVKFDDIFLIHDRIGSDNYLFTIIVDYSKSKNLQ